MLALEYSIPTGLMESEYDHTFFLRKPVFRAGDNIQFCMVDGERYKVMALLIMAHPGELRGESSEHNVEVWFPSMADFLDFLRLYGPCVDTIRVDN